MKRAERATKERQTKLPGFGSGRRVVCRKSAKFDGLGKPEERARQLHRLADAILNLPPLAREKPGKKPLDIRQRKR